MSTWRDAFLTRCGPGVLAGVTLWDWFKLLRENRFSIDAPYLLRAAFTTLAATINSPFRLVEGIRYRRQWENLSIEPPLFVLGHWRSGTTHLHYLLGLDKRFACPRLYEVHYPHTFLSTERYFSGLTRFFLPKRRPYDNVRLALDVPDEDEFAMCVMGGLSSYLAGVFPRRSDYYDQFLTLRRAPPQAFERWKSSLLLFLKKLTLRHGKPLIIKSPTHTGRIKLLLEMFPDARFVHIHRDPYIVFQSFMHTHETGLPYSRLQRTDRLDVTERVIRQYKELYDAYFEERELIPEGRFHQLAFADLERDPVAEMRRLYESLDLPDFAPVEPALRTYLDSLAGYRKNTFGELDPEIRSRIAREWRQSFEEWGYSTA